MAFLSHAYDGAGILRDAYGGTLSVFILTGSSSGINLGSLAELKNFLCLIAQFIDP